MNSPYPVTKKTVLSIPRKKLGNTIDGAIKGEGEHFQRPVKYQMNVEQNVESAEEWTMLRSSWAFNQLL
jgi:hypothetical protein